MNPEWTPKANKKFDVKRATLTHTQIKTITKTVSLKEKKLNKQQCQ